MSYLAPGRLQRFAQLKAYADEVKDIIADVRCGA